LKVRGVVEKKKITTTNNSVFNIPGTGGVLSLIFIYPEVMVIRYIKYPPNTGLPKFTEDRGANFQVSMADESNKLFIQ